MFTFDQLIKKFIIMIKMLHSGWAYITLIILVFAVVNALIGLTSKKEFKDKDLRISLFTLIVAHLQLIIGFIAYFLSAQFAYVLDNGMGAAMKQPEIRLFIIEHPLMMILAIVLITMGFSKHKKQTTDNGKFKTIALYYGIALIFVLSRIPWSQWLSF
jgi:heme A synthase